VPQNIDGIRILAMNGEWRAVAVLAEKCLGNTNKPHEQVIYKMFMIFGLFKSRDFKAAGVVLDGISHLDDAVYLYESHPQHYQKLKGSMIPFTMRILHAELPHYRDNTQETLDRYMQLLAFVRTQLQYIRTKADFDREDEKKWQQREERILLCIINILILQKDYYLAVKLFEEALSKQPNNLQLLSALAKLQLQLGYVETAQNICTYVESTIASPEKSVMALMNRGFLAVANNRYQDAVDCFDQIINLDSNNVAAINNRAVCYLYCEKLSTAISTLEDQLRKDPSNISESIIFNLVTLYDLASEDIKSKKQLLSKLVTKYCSDDFNMNSLRI